MPQKIDVVKDSGETISSNVVSVFMIPETSKRYIITTENAVDPHGLSVLHVSEITGENVLNKVETDEEWNAIKTVMRAIISGNVSSYQYMPALSKGLVYGPQYSRDISVSSSALQQMIDSYNLSNGSTPVNQAVSTQDSLGNAVTNGVQPVKQEVVANAPVAVPASNVNPATNVNPVSNIPSPIVASQPVEPVQGMANGVAAPVNQVVSDVANEVTNVPVTQVGSSIFPENPVVSNEEDEVSPGISEASYVPVEDEESADNSSEDSSLLDVPVLDSIATVDSSPTDIEALSNVEQATDTISIVPAEDESVNDTETQSNVDVAKTVVPNQVSTSIQQIAVPAVNDTEVEDDVNNNSNIDDNYLDELVQGTQSVENFSNLIRSMTEKFISNLEQREEQIKQKELVLNERERMLNEQMKILMANNQSGSAQVVGPTKVDASNDV